MARPDAPAARDLASPPARAEDGAFAQNREASGVAAVGTEARLMLDTPGLGLEALNLPGRP